MKNKSLILVFFMLFCIVQALFAQNYRVSVAGVNTYKKYKLKKNVGFITINTLNAARVYINGREYKDLKDIAFSPQVLSIRVIMPNAKPLIKHVLLKRNDRLNFNFFTKDALGTIKVTVNPANARIDLVGNSGEVYNAVGSHVFSGIPPGQYVLKVKAESYCTITKSVNLSSNQVLHQDFIMKKSAFGEIEMVFVKGSTFVMGNNDGEDDEKPEHKVTLSDFYISKYEVTQKLWHDLMGTNPSISKSCDECPVEHVSWNDVQEFIKKLDQKTGRSYRLPTEAEWEYAARGGNVGGSFKYSGSNAIYEVAWYDLNSGSKTHPVGQKKPNKLGIYDMTGNVWEWCSDWYDSNYYKNSSVNNPQGPVSGTSRIYRGGSWYTKASNCRLTYRMSFSPEGRYYNLGFRLVLPAE